MASQVGIVNLALIQLGEARITALTDDSEAARIATDIWEMCRDSVLVDHNWNFATTRTTLAALSTAPDFEYAYQFPLPTACLRVIEMHEPDYKFRVERVKIGANEYRVLLTDEATCEIRYIAKMTNTGVYHPKFVDALAARLAASMALALTGSKTKEKLAWEKYRLILADARSCEAMEGTPRVLEANEWLDARE